MHHRPLQRVLFVETDPDHRFLLECILDKHPELEHRVLHGFGSIRPAVEQFAPEMLVLSHGRLEQDAIPTIIQRRSWGAGRHLPVTLMTAMMAVEDIEEYEACDIAGVIEKPFEPSDFVRQLRRIYREWRARQRRAPRSV